MNRQVVPSKNPPAHSEGSNVSTDPCKMNAFQQPGLVMVQDRGEIFVANVCVDGHGWVRIVDWEGSTVRLPPHRVHSITEIETEPVPDSEDDFQIADTHWLEMATGEANEMQVMEL